jgi:hypothetical protein
VITAILTGTVVDDGGGICQCGFQWGPTIAFGNTTGTQPLVSGDVLTLTIAGLMPLAIYYYRIFAQSAIGVTYGNTLAIATPWGVVPNLTGVVTNPATGVTENAATLNGLIANDYGSPCTVWFEYGLTSAYGAKTTDQYGKLTGESFYARIGVGEGKVVHFRAVASNRYGMVHGSDMSFSSLSSLGPVGFVSEEDLLLGWEE